MIEVIISSVAGLLLFTALMVVAHKRKYSQAVYIPCCLAAACSATNLVMAGYGYYFGIFNLYFYIVTALVMGLIIDFIIRKTVTQNNV